MQEEEKGAAPSTCEVVDEPIPNWDDVARDYADEFLRERTAAADMSKQLSTLEAARTALRHEIVKRLMGEPSKLSKTVATDQARLSPEYIDISTKIVHVTNQWEIRFASAEYQRMMFKIVTVDADRAYDNQNAAAELERLQATLEKRIRQLKE
ncbi:hypothetical protein LCGC14_2901890 [marine sediment metagenome]|uniref:Uncharacterized protein n=1 Tax=marine sediment metagenome TaxID=412755 RepID=A0A0F8XUJ7_9ZZZZ